MNFVKIDLLRGRDAGEPAARPGNEYEVSVHFGDGREPEAG